MAKIGFIGLGHMGAPMALNLLKHPHQLIVHDVSTDAVNKLVQAGAQAAQSLIHLAQQCEIIITMLPAGQHVKEICLNENGLFNHVQKNTLIIDSSSIDVDTTRQLSELATQKQIQLLDAPVSGGVVGAEAGTLTFMVGGSTESFQRAQTILNCMGKNIIYAGAAGNGQAAKICNNMLLGISMIGVCEAFILAQKLGLDPQTFFNISSTASGQCWSMTSYCPVPGPVAKSPANNDYQAGFTAAMMLKDLKLSQTAAQSVGVSTPLGAEATALYSLFANLGHEQMDFSGIIKMLEGRKK